MRKGFNLENQLCFEVYKASNQFTKLYRQVLDEFELTYPQYLVLLALWEQDQLLVKELSEKVTLGIGTLNPIVNKLVNKGWITKESSTEDKRAVIVSLTEKAKKDEQVITNKILQKVSQCDSLVELDSELKSRLHELNKLLEQLNEME
ncbi:MarR family winged helix-turn-helix transcriptional regulator [Rummeliibacillus sp. NPDC094406]|uniref:MarR family winged helix-turn-helix transcriptional regulator n=1 Tax=Rummeliibacillus sp. NPDC094406 TaxID=3364511 RepID=UPI0037F2C70F